MRLGYVFLVEGDSDARFINGVIRPKLSGSTVSVIDYSQEPDGKISSLIDAFDDMYRDTYILRDYDHGQQDCTSIQDRIAFVEDKFGPLGDCDVIIVMDEIEGWYLAGLDDDDADSIGISVPDSTENVGKDDFSAKLEQSTFSSEINLQKEIINMYSIATAKTRNSSFAFFASELGI